MPVSSFFLRTLYQPAGNLWLVAVACLLSVCQFSATAQAQKEAITIANLTLDVPDAAAIQNHQTKNPKKPLAFATYYYGFQKGDVLLLNLENEKGKATFTLDIRDYASGSLVYAVKGLKKLKNISLPVTHKAVYTFTLSADAAEGKSNTCQFTIKRLPAHDSVRNFNSHVTWHTRHDTTWATVKEKVLVNTDIVP